MWPRKPTNLPPSGESVQLRRVVLDKYTSEGLDWFGMGKIDVDETEDAYHQLLRLLTKEAMRKMLTLTHLHLKSHRCRPVHIICIHRQGNHSSV